LTRFFALHAGVLPAAVTALVVGHVYLFRRHGITAKQPFRRPDAAFWPDQVLRDAVACLAVLATVLFLILRHRIFGGHGPLGAELGAPADPSEQYSAARPEWYFMFLFQFLKYFPGESEVWGAVVIPGLVVLVLFLIPFIGPRKRDHWFDVIFPCTLVAGALVLTYLAAREDRHNESYQAAVKRAEQEADRVRVLAKSPAGIPSSGAVTLLRNDPLTQGPKLFAQKCASCHRYDGHDSLGNVPSDPQAASDLKGFGSREWLTGLLDPEKITTTNYFGATKFHNGKMVKFVTKDVRGYSPEQKQKLEKVIIAISAEAQLKSQFDIDERDKKIIGEGRALIQSEVKCMDCHQFHNKDEEASGPDLTGYGSRKWLINFINNPAHPDFYGERNDRMPAFGSDQILTPQAVGLIADWLRGNWYEPAQ
jgi:ubiquinol-cytochrome c reductase cytochrome b subunit